MLGGAASPAADGDLVTQARRGEATAQQHLCERYHLVLFNFLRHLVGAELAADLAQEALARALARLHRLRDEAAFRAWLFRIARNLVTDQQRRTKPLPLPADELVDFQGDVPRQVERAELRARIEAAVEALPRPQREVVVMHHLLGFSLDDIARCLRLPTGTVKSRLARARATLRRRLAPYLEA